MAEGGGGGANDIKNHLRQFTIRIKDMAHISLYFGYDFVSSFTKLENRGVGVRKVGRTKSGIWDIYQFELSSRSDF